MSERDAVAMFVEAAGAELTVASFVDVIAKMRDHGARGTTTVYLNLHQTYHLIAFVDDPVNEKNPLGPSAKSYRGGHRAGDNHDPSAARAFKSALERLPASVPWGETEARICGTPTVATGEPGDLSTASIAADIREVAARYHSKTLRHQRRLRKVTRGWA